VSGDQATPDFTTPRPGIINGVFYIPERSMNRMNIDEHYGETRDPFGDAKSLYCKHCDYTTSRSQNPFRPGKSDPYNSSLMRANMIEHLLGHHRDKLAATMKTEIKPVDENIELFNEAVGALEIYFKERGEYFPMPKKALSFIGSEYIYLRNRGRLDAMYNIKTKEIKIHE
jgi:hypothetical protein